MDGLSDCGRYGISIIAFIGSVFSPWYRWAGRRDPANHCCINVATYGAGGRWTMTERGRSALDLEEDSIAVGPSHLRWTGDHLEISVDERATPYGTRMRGTIRLHPTALTDAEVVLTPEGTHVWRPFAPTARIEVDWRSGGVNWSGHGYFDANFGTRALEDDFSYWTWGRFPHGDGSVAFYDADRRDGTSLETALAFGPDGNVARTEAPPKTRLRRSLWTVRRETRCDPGATPRQVQAMLDAPFYTRSAVETVVDGETVTGVHEALDLRRFASPLLKPMLAVRVPRRTKWR
ncbi:carotenoid 1,2-hydratase [Pontivivens ytuae]|uniref:carotenoid 1,2-hydratase n=1 Tax=Pontivivens ytuae TaxID=2789856 RepID=UPI002410F50A|nr:carotenoid 1,2-hydratase [Pontivivens ytuae]